MSKKNQPFSLFENILKGESSSGTKNDIKLSGFSFKRINLPYILIYSPYYKYLFKGFKHKEVIVISWSWD